MNELLKKIKLDFIKLVKENKAVLGAWNWGSEAHGLCDEYSDVDIVLLIEGKSFHKFSEELIFYLNKLSDKILTCFPEGFNSSSIINNGYLLMKNNSIFQFDVFLINSDKSDDFMCRLHYTKLKSADVIFDRNGEIAKLIQLNITGSVWNDDIGLLESTYWYHAFMTTKYLKRKDYFKLNNVLRTMYDAHASMLLCGYDKINWGGMANKLHFIPEDKQKHLMYYYCTENFKEVSENILQCMKSFKEDSMKIHLLKNTVYNESAGDNIIENWINENGLATNCNKNIKMLELNIKDYVIEKLNLSEYEKCSNIWNMSADPYTEQFRNEIEAGNRIVYVYKVNGKFLGEIAYVFDMNDSDYTIPQKRIYLSRLIVKNEYRNKGIGSILIDFVIEEIKNLGYNEISIGVDKDNKAALHLYRKKGFTKIIFDGTDELGEYYKLVKIL